MRKPLHAAIIITFSGISFCTPFIDPGDPRLDAIRLPEGFRISIYADHVTNARSMCLGKKGTLFVGTREEGSVYAVIDHDKDHKADKVVAILTGLNMPNGVAFRDGSLYVAEVNRVIRLDRIEDNLAHPPVPVVVIDNLPADRHHGWKYIAFGPDGLLYVPVGAPCNVCEREDQRYASILRQKRDGSGMEVFASGVRNTVGFTWHPQTGELWFTDNGRDLLGDDSPPDELNHAPRQGMHFGFPYCHGNGIADPKFGPLRDCSEFTEPVQNLGPHVAALGIKFYTGTMFPEEYRNAAFIAEHGSWNRSTPIGYRITLVKTEGGKALSYAPFAEGWLLDSGVWGRPVDILQLPDGSLLVSDDTGDRVYRISYGR